MSDPADATFELRVDVDETGPVAVVRVAGELDISGAARLQAVLADVGARHPGADLPVDLSRLRFIDSTGLGVLLAATRRVAPGRVVLRAPTAPVLRLLDVAGCAELFAIET